MTRAIFSVLHSLFFSLSACFPTVRKHTEFPDTKVFVVEKSTHYDDDGFTIPLDDPWSEEMSRYFKASLEGELRKTRFVHVGGAATRAQ
jgi:hypothetical protein